MTTTTCDSPLAEVEVTLWDSRSRSCCGGVPWKDAKENIMLTQDELDSLTVADLKQRILRDYYATVKANRATLIRS